MIKRIQLAIFAVSIFFGCSHSKDQVDNAQRKSVYQVQKSNSPPIIDGQLADIAWNSSKWSAYFVDIEGDKRPTPFLKTRIKMLWDDSYLYIGAELEETDIWGYITEKNVPIYKYGNDFEVFIDPDRDNHNYYELELNPLNTIWELTLEKPYRNGGPAIDPTNLDGLKTAVAYRGTINEGSDIDTSWTVEIAIPFNNLYNYRKNHTRVLKKPIPEEGDIWGLNFSRVHWEHEIVDKIYKQAPNKAEYNWVWSPQGKISMHEPEEWGLLIFCDKEQYKPDRNEEAIRDYLMKLYKGQLDFKKESGYFANSIEELKPSHPLPVHLKILNIQATGEQFVIEARYADKNNEQQVLHINESSFLSSK